MASRPESAVRGPWVALELRSAELAVAVLPENGCDIVEVIDRSTGVDVMVRTPWGFGRRPVTGPKTPRLRSMIRNMNCEMMSPRMTPGTMQKIMPIHTQMRARNPPLKADRNHGPPLNSFETVAS